MDNNYDENNVNTELNQKPEEEIKEVKLSKKATGAILIVLLLVLAVVIYKVRGCSLEKEVKNIQNQQVVNTEIESTGNSTSKVVENKSKNVENLPKSEESDSLRDDKSTTPEKSDLDEEVVKTQESKEILPDKTTPKSGSMEQVNEPVLSEVKEASAMVSSKSIYRVDGTSFAYSVDLVLLRGTDDYIAVKYFCPRKTFDALLEGDSVKVDYQVDSNDTISISSVSR